ncbi:hypothetical protein Tco_0966249 [Tanacetum coccineum]
MVNVTINVLHSLPGTDPNTPVSGSGFKVRTGFRRGWVKDGVVTCDGGRFKVVAGKLWEGRAVKQRSDGWADVKKRVITKTLDKAAARNNMVYQELSNTAAETHKVTTQPAQSDRHSTLKLMLDNMAYIPCAVTTQPAQSDRHSTLKLMLDNMAYIPCALEDIRLSAQKKNLIPLLFNVDVNEVGNILAENSESKECKEAVDGLLRSHEFKFKANEGNWRLGVAKTAGILKGKLGRMSTVEPEIESFYENLFPKNKIFVGRQKELADRSPRSDKINIDEFFNHGALEGKEPDVDTTFSNGVFSNGGFATPVDVAAEIVADSKQ